MPGYHGVDTVYHDRQHSLDMTLAMARLLVGYERSVETRMRFGAERAAMALVTSLFHDAGYIREFGDRQHRNGAEFTLYHVTRSARFLARKSIRSAGNWPRPIQRRRQTLRKPARLIRVKNESPRSIRFRRET